MECNGNGKAGKSRLDILSSHSSNINVIILTIILLFGQNYISWMWDKDITDLCVNDSYIKDRIRLAIPLRPYPQSSVQSYSLVITIRYIYHMLAIFILTASDYYSSRYNFENIIGKYLLIRYNESKMTIDITIQNLSERHVISIRNAVHLTTLSNIKRRLTKHQEIFTTYIVLFNTLHHIAHNKLQYETHFIYSFLSPKPNISSQILPHISTLLNMDYKLRNVLYRPRFNLILLYPMGRNIMINNKSNAIRTRHKYLNLSTYILTANYTHDLEHILKKYNQHYDTLAQDIRDHDYKWIDTDFNNPINDDVFI